MHAGFGGFPVAYSAVQLEAGMPNKSAVSIVDDDPSVLEGMKDLLNSKGFAAQTFQRA